MSRPTSLLEQSMNIDSVNPNFAPDSFDERIYSNGVSWTHWKAIPCPGSDSESGSIRSTHEGHSCENGFYYKRAGCFTAVLQNNNLNKIVKPEGLVDTSLCYLILPRFYDDKPTESLNFSIWDKITLTNCAEVSCYVPFWEKLTISQTGIDRTRFKIKKAEYVIDAYGNEFTNGIDYQIVSGNVNWISQNRPGFNQLTNLGSPYSIRYLYEPQLYINKVLHQIRVLNTVDPNTGEKKEIRYPQLLECIRETAFLDRQVSSQDDSANEDQSPGDGSNFTTPK